MLALLDRTAALGQVGGDLDLLRELVDLFREDWPRLLNQMAEAITQGDLHQLQQNAHAERCGQHFRGVRRRRGRAAAGANGPVRQSFVDAARYKICKSPRAS